MISEVDCIEINPDLQHILKGKEYRVVHDDFLTFNSQKHYDLIVANFPFSQGDAHLQKALSLVEESGGILICLVNAETIKNPYTNLRKAVAGKLSALNAGIEFLSDEFKQAERPTGVEVALIKVEVEKAHIESSILDSLKRAKAVEVEENQANALAERNFLNSAVANFNLECRLGIKLIDEYFVLKPYIKNRFVKEGETDYSSPILELKIKGGYSGESKSNLINDYLKEVREKYWANLLSDSRFYSKYTSNIQEELSEKRRELRNYDFTIFNIRELEEELAKKITQGIESSILKMFEEFSNKFAWFGEGGNNIHYYNGWKTNKAHKINPKVIIPMNGFSSVSWGSKQKKLDRFYIEEKMSDMVKVFNYLAGEHTEAARIVGQSVEMANNYQSFSNIDMRYFETTFYKKGTCHIRFKDQRLLDKFNIYGSQRKNWLPPSYGKKHYEEMNTEEKQVIDEFQGKEKYEEVMKESSYYLVETKTLMLSAGLAE